MSGGGRMLLFGDVGTPTFAVPGVAVGSALGGERGASGPPRSGLVGGGLDDSLDGLILDANLDGLFGGLEVGLNLAACASSLEPRDKWSPTARGVTRLAGSMDAGAGSGGAGTMTG